MRTKGISIIVCCFDSASRIEVTLTHLFDQKVKPEIKWEIIVIDNNSSDDTSDVALNHYESSGTGIPFKVVSEPRPGLTNAREKGFSTALYNIVLMVDDDNSLSDNYLNGIWEGFKTSGKIGMVGGKGIPVLEKEPPSWFEEYASCFALGGQSDPARSNQADLLYGAGLALRMDILDNLKLAGFKSILSDRSGTNLMSGGDTELCFVYLMAGYRMVYDEKLTFEHHLPSSRINWGYLKRLFTGFGMTKARTAIYTAALSNRSFPENGRFPLWLDRALYLMGSLGKDAWLLVRDRFVSMEGNRNVLSAIARLGEIRGIIGLRDRYLDHYKTVYGLKQALEEIG